MKRALIVVLALAMVGAFTGLTVAKHVGSDDTMTTPKPRADARELWNYMKLTGPYTTWPKWPGTDEMYKGTQPHGAFLTTRVTRETRAAIIEKAGEFPDGSIIVKENYTPDKDLAAVTVMYKVDGYNPEAGDWFWAKYGPDGSVDAAGKVDGCIQCHQAKADNDWVFTGEIK